MRIALSWLKDHVELPADLGVEDLARHLTMLGLEVETVERYEQVTGNLEGVVVGHVLTCAQHPNADRLKVTTVDTGQAQPLHIVCGAPNVAVGQYVLVATVGATIYPTEGEPIQLKKGKIRGEVSEGMICAADELGLGTDHDGILVLQSEAAPGTPASDVLHLHTDWVVEIGLTPNRTDAISHRGVARDLAASMGLPLKLGLPALQTEALPAFPLTVTVESPDRCPRYSGLVIEGLAVAESPTWLQQRLLSVGARPRNAVVDITNYVMFDTGQPLHAFDLDEVANDTLSVRTLPTGTPFTSLFDDTVSLSDQDLLIADSQGPLCIGGVLGGKRSGVTETTKRIFLESAWFDAVSVRQSKRRHGFFSESAYRFERGIDPERVVDVLKQAAALITGTCGGQATQPIDILQQPVVWAEVVYDMARARRLIGKDVSDVEQLAILERLEIEIHPTEQDHVRRLRIPPYRHDVTRFQDVVEEVLRHYGYNNVPDAPVLTAALSYANIPQPRAVAEYTAHYLAAQGWHECVTNSLGSADDVDTRQGVPMANPLSEEIAWLRTSLLPNLLQVAAHNLNRQQPDVRVFELGKTYHATANAYTETPYLALLALGSQEPEQWAVPSENTGFFNLKGTVNGLLAALSIPPVVQQVVEPNAEVAYGIRWSVGNDVIGHVGLVEPTWARKYGVKVPVFAAVINWDQLLALRPQRPAMFQPLPSQPAVRRDVSLRVPAGVTYQAIEAAVASASALVQDMRVFDVFEKEGVRSYTLALRLQDPEKTLTDKQVDKAVARVLEVLETQLGVTLRT